VEQARHDGVEVNYTNPRAALIIEHDVVEFGIVVRIA
jgi:hypothetical protein